MKVIQVFEHERLRVGEERRGVIFSDVHFSALARLNEQHHSQLFTMLHQGIQFSSEVGVIQVPGLTLEILPKADQKSGTNYNLWRNVLVDMLVQCHWVNLKTTGSASLYLKKGAILEVYIAAFLQEVEHLLHQGLVKQYRPVEGNIRYWKGRLLFARQLQNHLTHQERVYAIHQVYDYHHPLNQIIVQALQIALKLTCERSSHLQARQLLSQFPALKTLHITPQTFSQIQYNRLTAHYRKAIHGAQLLLYNYVPELQFGTYHTFMLLFNMDYLFEAFIFEQVRRVANQYNLEVHRQVSASFWDKKKIRPDILVYHKKTGKKYVIDTKWKKLKTHQPATEDLRQMYVYNQYFGAEKGLLLYPAVYPLEMKNEAFALPENKGADKPIQKNHCALGFIDILDTNGNLSREIGARVLQMLISE